MRVVLLALLCIPALAQLLVPALGLVWLPPLDEYVIQVWIAAGLLGAVSWRWAVQPAVHRAAAALAELACRPLRLVHKMLVRPAQMRLQAAQSRRRACRKAKKSAKIKKSAEKQLQKPSKVLYN